MNFLIDADVTAASTAGCMALVNVAPRLAEADPAYRDRLERFLRRCRDDDLRVAAAVEDGGELRVVRRTTTASSCRARSATYSARRWCTSCASCRRAQYPRRTPTGPSRARSGRTPGLKIISITTAPRRGPASLPDQPREEHPRLHRAVRRGVRALGPCVPRRRGGVLGGARPTRWARGARPRRRHTCGRSRVDLRTRPDDRRDEWRTRRHPHPRQAEQDGRVGVDVPCGWTAALVHAETTDAGMVVPADAHVYATMAYGRSLFNEMVSYLDDVSGAPVDLPDPWAIYENPQNARLHGEVPPDDGRGHGRGRMKIFHVIRDLGGRLTAAGRDRPTQMVGGASMRSGWRRCARSRRKRPRRGCGGWPASRSRRAGKRHDDDRGAVQGIPQGRALHLPRWQTSHGPGQRTWLQAAVQAAADVYDSFHSDDPDAFNPIYIMPKSIEEFRGRERLLARNAT